jgi:outer membrane protein OmpA-like peptidoglycan-associated protein
MRRNPLICFRGLTAVYPVSVFLLSAVWCAADSGTFRVLDPSGAPVRECRVAVQRDEVRLTLTNRRFILDGGTTKIFRAKDVVTVFLNGKTVFNGRLPSGGRLYFLNPVTTSPEPFPVPQPEPSGSGSGGQTPVIPAASGPVSDDSPNEVSSNPSSEIPVPASMSGDEHPAEEAVLSESRIPLSESRDDYVSIREVADRFYVRIPDVLFDRNQSRIPREARKVLSGLEPWLSSTGGSVVVRGYTDDTGPAEYNRRLSEQRAQSVADFLVGECGLARDRLMVFGLGEEDPIADNASAAGRAQNRRVTIEIKK